MTGPEPPAADYAEARARFLAAAEESGAGLGHRVHPSEVGPEGEELAIDIARLGAPDTRDVLVIVSGTHGVEGFAGSSLQTTWLGSAVTIPDRVGVVLVHAWNPYGFAWVRRVNEDNVDLNRNFVDFDDPLPENPGYDEIADLVVPEDWTEQTRARTDAALMEHAARHGTRAMQEHVSGGQYRHPTGIFYGGTGPTWSQHRLRDLCLGPLGDARRVAIVDIHTGLGPWGQGELLSSDPIDSDRHERAVDWYGDEVTSVVDGTSVSAPLHGEWLPRAAEWLEPAETTAIAIEYGTVEVLETLQALRADAWLHAHGDPTGPGAAEIRAALRRAFADDDPAWIAALWDRFVAVADIALERLAGD